MAKIKVEGEWKRFDRIIVEKGVAKCKNENEGKLHIFGCFSEVEIKTENESSDDGLREPPFEEQKHPWMK